MIMEKMAAVHFPIMHWGAKKKVNEYLLKDRHKARGRFVDSAIHVDGNFHN